MDANPIIEGLKTVAGMVTGVFDFLGKGRLDQTKAAELYYGLNQKLRELETHAWQLQLALTEKLMAQAPWRAPLALASGGALIAVCAFNLVARSVGWADYAVDPLAPEVLLLVGLFLFVAAGDVELLKQWVARIVEWKAKRNQAKEDKRT